MDTDLRALGARLTSLWLATVLGVASAIAIFAAFPTRGMGVVWCTIAILVVLACGLAVGWYAVLEAVRRRVPHPAPRLPVARIQRRSPRARCESQRELPWPRASA